MCKRATQFGVCSQANAASFRKRKGGIAECAIQFGFARSVLGVVVGVERGREGFFESANNIRIVCTVYAKIAAFRGRDGCRSSIVNSSQDEQTILNQILGNADKFRKKQGMIFQKQRRTFFQNFIIFL